MKKSFILLLVLGLIFAWLASSQADSTRTKTLNSACVSHIETVAVGHGATLHKISGRATSASAWYSLHDTATLGECATTNVKMEGGEATQYDSIGVIDFGDQGLVFNTGITVYTLTADLVLLYE